MVEGYPHEIGEKRMNNSFVYNGTLNEAEVLLRELPETVRDELPDTKAVRPRVRALTSRQPAEWDPATMLRLQLLERHAATVAEHDRQDREAAAELRRLSRSIGSTLHNLCGIAARIQAELLVEVGDPRVNACLHRIAVTQLRCDPRARCLYDDVRRRGHTKKEAMRILKRHLSDVVYRQ
ncbi:MAG: hypothetical protein M3Q72_00590 [Actinomycetota bacterium]|nr:hypothetical protein [Actinomycetota bacterium]